MNLIRKQVSSDRRRYKNDDYDLDLTYITQNILAMGFPASGMECVYRNNIDDVRRFLEEMHSDRYMVFNLSGREYDKSKFNNNVLEFGWPDHHAPPVSQLYHICVCMHSWLSADPKNVVVVHCVAGKGRTGTVISAYLLWSHAVENSQAALNYFARMRSERSIGVQYPSQHRSVRNFEHLIRLSQHKTPPEKEVVIAKVVVHGVPNFDHESGGCQPILHVMNSPCITDGVETSGTIFRSSWAESPVLPEAGGMVFEVDRLCKGDILARFYHCPSFTQTFGGTGPTAKMMFRFSFNTYCNGQTFHLSRQEIDLAHLEKNSKRFPPDFSVDVVLEEPNPNRDYSHDLVSERVRVKKEGWLYKKGKINKAFKRRWFLMNDNFLSYYRNKETSKPAGSISLEDAQVVMCSHPDMPHCFELNTPSRNYCIGCDTEKELESWVSAVIRSKALFQVMLSTNSLSQIEEDFCDQPRNGSHQDGRPHADHCEGEEGEGGEGEGEGEGEEGGGGNSQLAPNERIEADNGEREQGNKEGQARHDEGGGDGQAQPQPQEGPGLPALAAGERRSEGEL